VAAPSERQRKQLEGLQAEMAQKYARLFAMPEGKELLTYLTAKFFDGDLLGDTPEETAFNLGAREVVRRMRNLAALITKQEATHGG
jgi:hypothetical protein